MSSARPIPIVARTSRPRIEEPLSIGREVELRDPGGFERDVKPLWTCPKCGHQFVPANLWHSCGHYELESFICEAYAVGRQEYLAGRRTPG